MWDDASNSCNHGGETQTCDFSGQWPGDPDWVCECLICNFFFIVLILVGKSKTRAMLPHIGILAPDSHSTKVALKIFE